MKALITAMGASRLRQTSAVAQPPEVKTIHKTIHTDAANIHLIRRRQSDLP